MAKKQSLTLADLTDQQRKLFDQIMKGRKPLFRDDLAETLADISKLSNDQVKAELVWYCVHRPARQNGSSAGYAMSQAIGSGAE